MGEVFAGRYELVDPVGHGGTGAVWRAWDHRRHRYVAAKVLRQSDAHTLLRFVREQAVRIDHPHVLAPLSWAADDDKVLFTMDLVGGGSLAHLVGDYGPLSPRLVCLLLDQLLGGLAAVHAEGVVHRDVKPANLLLEATGTGRPHLRLSDFGIALRKGEPRLTEFNIVVGTPGYIAPEQLQGEEPDFPADLYAVGLVALYLLTGAKPDARALVDRFNEQGTPPAPRGVPEALWQVLASLLQPDPDARFRTATGVRKAVLAAAEALPEDTPDDEEVEVFDHLGPLPEGFGPDGPGGRPRGRHGRREGQERSTTGPTAEYTPGYPPGRAPGTAPQAGLQAPPSPPASPTPPPTPPPAAPPPAAPPPARPPQHAQPAQPCQEAPHDVSAPWTPAGTQTPWAPADTPPAPPTPWATGNTPPSTPTPWSPAGDPSGTPLLWPAEEPPSGTPTPWSAPGTPASPPAALPPGDGASVPPRPASAPLAAEWTPPPPRHAPPGAHPATGAPPLSDPPPLPAHDPTPSGTPLDAPPQTVASPSAAQAPAGGLPYPVAPPSHPAPAGPSRRTTVILLSLALACLAFGIWALAATS